MRPDPSAREPSAYEPDRRPRHGHESSYDTGDRRRLDSPSTRRRRHSSSPHSRMQSPRPHRHSHRGSSRSPHSRKYRSERSLSPTTLFSHSRSRRHDARRSSRQQDYPRSRSPPRRRRSRSPQPHHRSRRRSYSQSRSPYRRPRSPNLRNEPPLRRDKKPLPSQVDSYRQQDVGQPGDDGPPKEKDKPNFKPTGLLAAETNKVTLGSGKDAKSVTLKYHEPSEARKPPANEAWVMYVFKGTAKEPLDTIPLHLRSCWLFGREPAVADVRIEHPSCSKQHAVFQFRHIVKKDEYGEKKAKIGLYLLDLESANGTMLNGEKVEVARYVECRPGDVVKFGDSTREYVILLPPKT